MLDQILWSNFLLFKFINEIKYKCLISKLIRISFIGLWDILLKGIFEWLGLNEQGKDKKLPGNENPIPELKFKIPNFSHRWIFKLFLEDWEKKIV